MDVSVSSLAQSSATSSSSSVLPSDSASQFASTLSEPEASSTEHTVKRRKLRAIATWDHFRGAQGDEPRAISGNLLHYCKRCRNPSWSTHISSNARYHLKKAHHIFVREDSSSQNKRQLAIENAFARTTARQLQQVREHERNTLRSVINVDAFREAQMLLSAHRHLPLNFVTWPEYQALLTAVNPAVQEFLTDSGNTVAADLDRAYDAHQQSVKKWLEHARSLVHIAMDVWSSPQRKAYVAVHAQWVDEAYKPRKALLGLPNLRRSHAGAAMTPHLMEIIRKYHLAPRIGYFTGDNDAKNDTCLRQLAVGLSQEYGLTFDPVSSRTRCAGHIINLSLQAFLFATSEDALQAAIEQAQDEANDVTVSDALHDRIQSNTCQKSHGRRNKRNDTAGWRSIGPMDNIAVFIRNSTVRNDAWDDIAGKALGIDNITRWNSWFKLLDAAISQEGPLSIFLNQYHEELEDDILTHDDWQVLKMAHEFLQPFYQATLEQQMEWASIDQVLENMDILFLQFENAKVKYVNNARMVNSVHMDAVFGVFCRRFGVPLIDGGTVRLQAIIGLGRAMDMILTGRPVSAQEALQFGLANRVVPKGQALAEATKIAKQLLTFPQECMNVDRANCYYSVYNATSFQDALRNEFENGVKVITTESVKGAANFSSGAGRHGVFETAKF
ncbi:hypothetical protein HZS61_015836 [Fusarium oxysporum f. sp. conglutinans]|uniref:Transposase-like protein n=3 Tax=Fusarium oxysporum f. sp. conglutinans TaxID=100902 RepID=A0A8H6GNJ2_FUSOX|nr:hypothetical protein HZS61_015836 [Fusarium oxysporum f. sp. conglutinans]